MALVQNIERVTKARQVVHKPKRCLASDFIGPGDKKYLQLDTYHSGGALAYFATVTAHETGNT